jgi:hypothetical protein
MNVKRVQTIFINTKNRTKGSTQDCIVYLPDNTIRSDEGVQLRLTVLHSCLNKSFYNVRENYHSLRSNTFKPINGGSYIELPDWLKGPKRGLTNIQNMQQQQQVLLAMPNPP